MTEHVNPFRLHPDGAPGELERRWREQIGDAAYEAATARGDRTADAHVLQRQSQALAARARVDREDELVRLLRAVRHAVPWVAAALIVRAVAR